MQRIIMLLILALAVLALANDLVKEKQTTLSAMQRSYVVRENLIKALQDSIVRYQDLQKLSAGYMMCLRDDIQKLQADTTKQDSVKKGKKNEKNN